MIEFPALELSAEDSFGIRRAVAGESVSEA